MRLPILGGAARAVSDSPAQTAEFIRSSLVQAQLSLVNDPKTSAVLVEDAEIAYQTGLSSRIAASNPDAHLRIVSAFESLADSIARSDDGPLSRRNARRCGRESSREVIQLLKMPSKMTTDSTAQTWLPVREFRVATRFSRPNVGATLAVEGFLEGTVSVEDVLLSVRADVLDTYQARMSEALLDLKTADANGFAVRRAELAALAEGISLSFHPPILNKEEHLH